MDLRLIGIGKRSRADKKSLVLVPVAKIMVGCFCQKWLLSPRWAVLGALLKWEGATSQSYRKTAWRMVGSRFSEFGLGDWL